MEKRDLNEQISADYIRSYYEEKIRKTKYTVDNGYVFEGGYLLNNGLYFKNNCKILFVNEKEITSRESFNELAKASDIIININDLSISKNIFGKVSKDLEKIKRSKYRISRI